MKNKNNIDLTSDDIKYLENFIKKYEDSLIKKNKDLRLTIEEASLVISSMTKILLREKILIQEKEKNQQNINKKDKSEEELIKIDLDFGFFKKN